MQIYLQELDDVIISQGRIYIRIRTLEKITLTTLRLQYFPPQGIRLEFTRQMT